MTNESPELLRSYGRRQGRKLRPNRGALMETLFPRLLVTLPEGAIDPASLFPNKNAPLWFEIGFGAGEHLLEQARRNPNINFIGCEPFINGMASLLAGIDAGRLTNVRLYDGDARHLLEKLPDASLARLFVLFPDPWPKTRHHKRRLISQATLELFYRKLKPGAPLRIATDHVDYGAWILEHLQAFGKLTWTAESQADWNMPPSDWVPTRYQAKAAEEGRKAMFLEWVKPN